MPTAPLRHCSGSPTCPHLIGNGRECPLHPRPKPWQSQHGPAPQRIRGRRLQRLRQQLFSREPLCRLCMAEGRVTLATVRDHVTPLAEGGADIESNVQPICAACSDAKSRREAQRGQARHR